MCDAGQLNKEISKQLGRKYLEMRQGNNIINSDKMKEETFKKSDYVETDL